MQETEQIKSRLDLVDYIQQFFPLNQIGPNWKARCPFHDEKTPSFIVSRSKQMWHCFGCNEGGDIFNFVMRYEGVDFAESLRLLAPKAGVTLAKRDPKQFVERDRLEQLCSLAATYYHEVLLRSRLAEPARAYLKERRISSEMIDEFRLGFAPDEKNSAKDLNNLLIQKGFRQDDVIKAGLALASSRGFGYRDRFRGRIMFPIADAHGRTVAFTSRILPGHDDGMGKYVNSPATPLYNKSEILYGLHLAKDAIRKQDLAVMVEGNMDVIALHQRGIRNVVASSGTALTREQIALVRRFSENICFSFDADAAGIKAAERGFDAALEAGMTVYRLHFPAETHAKDPDEFVSGFQNSEEAQAAWNQLIHNKKLFLEDFFDATLAETSISSPQSKRKTAHKLLSLVQKISDPIERTHWLQQISARLNIPEEVLYEVLKNARQKTPASPVQVKSQATGAAKPDRQARLEQDLLGLLFMHEVLVPLVAERLQPEIFSSDLHTLYKHVVLFYTQPRDHKLSFFPAFLNYIQTLSPDESSVIRGRADLAALAAEDRYHGFTKEACQAEVLKIVSELKHAYYSGQMEKLQQEIRELEQRNDGTSAEKLQDLTKQYQLILGQLANLQQS